MPSVNNPNPSNVREALDCLFKKVQTLTAKDIAQAVFIGEGGGTISLEDALHSQDQRVEHLQNEITALSEKIRDISNPSEDIALQIANRIYSGIDLTVKFNTEIAAAPYNGDPWAWIKSRIKAINFTDINVGDYIPWKSTNGYKVKSEVAGIDTYYNYGDIPVGHHIDFISRDCWPEAIKMNLANYNNGTNVSPYPWLSCNAYAKLNSLAISVPNATTASPALVAVDYRTSGVYDKLPATLKNIIVEKRLQVPQRYTAGSLLVDDNSWGWVDVGKLWMPSEFEIYGYEHWGSKNSFSSAAFQQYPIFTNNMKRIKGIGDGGNRILWCFLTGRKGSSTAFACVYDNAVAGNAVATHEGGVPICFRIDAK